MFNSHLGELYITLKKYNTKSSQVDYRPNYQDNLLQYI
jgi:hypothetical protein